MNANLRACVAYLVARLAGAGEHVMVFDFGAGRHVRHSGTVSGSSINVFAIDRGAFLTGAPPNLHDHGSGATVTLHLDGTAFSGLDWGSGKPYSGQVEPGMIRIRDEETAQTHSYGVPIWSGPDGPSARSDVESDDPSAEGG